MSEEILILSVIAGIVILMLGSLWKVFEKADIPGWHALIPVYNYYQYTQIAGVSGWWTLGFFVPFFDIFARVFVGMELAKKFGKDSLFGLGLGIMSVIFLPILAFGSATYEAETPSKTFINEDGIMIEEIPLQDWE